MKQPLISFIVLNWNSGDTIKECLDSIRQQTQLNFEIIVVDNGSADGSTAKLEQLTDIKLIKLPQNIGFTGGQITGYKAASGEYLALINSDATIAPNWSEQILRRFKPTTAAVAGKVFAWGNDNNGDYLSYQTVNPYTANAELKDDDVASDKPVNSVSAATVMISRAAVKKVGYFEDTFFAYYEETDLFARFKRHGYTIEYQPTAHAWHKGAATLGGTSYRFQYLMNRNRFLFAARNFDPGYFRYYLVRYIGRELLSPFLAVIQPSRRTERRARIRAFGWNIARFYRTMRQRRTLINTGSYNHQLVLEQAQRVSIIITNYNYADFVAQAISSAQKQTAPAGEIIVIDDGSTDQSKQVLEAFAHNAQIKLINQANSGVVAAKNIGLAQAHGEWIVYLDADDTLASSFTYETLVAIQKNERRHLGFVYCDTQLSGALKGIKRAPRYSLWRLLFGNYISNTALVRRLAAETAGGFSAAFNKGYEDWNFYLTLGEAGWKGLGLKQPLMTYHIHTAAGRNQTADKNLSEIQSLVVATHPGLYHGLTLRLYIISISSIGRLTKKLLNALALLFRGDLAAFNQKLSKNMGGE